MKKLLLSVAVVAALCASCSGSKSVEANENELKTKIENCTNTDSLKLYVDQAKAYAEKLVKEGKVDEAKKYLDELKPVVDKYAPSLAGTFASVQSALDKVPSSPTDSLKAAGTEAVDSLKSKTSQAVDAAGNVVEAGKDAVANAADKVGDKASEVASSAKEKAADAADAAADKVHDLLGK